jgi:hypothetical protein
MIVRIRTASFELTDVCVNLNFDFDEGGAEFQVAGFNGVMGNEDEILGELSANRK